MFYLQINAFNIYGFILSLRRSKILLVERQLSRMWNYETSAIPNSANNHWHNMLVIQQRQLLATSVKERTGCEL